LPPTSDSLNTPLATNTCPSEEPTNSDTYKSKPQKKTKGARWWKWKRWEEWHHD